MGNKNSTTTASPLGPCYLTNLNHDCFCVAMSYLPLSSACKARLVCKEFDETVQSDDFWAIMCASRGISGKLVDEGTDVNYELEPNPFKRLHGPREREETILHWQLAVVLWMCRDNCPHLSEENLRKALPAWRAAIARSSCAATVSAEQQRASKRAGSCEWPGCNINNQGNYVCAGCARRFCTRGGNSHMATHYEHASMEPEDYLKAKADPSTAQGPLGEKYGTKLDHHSCAIRDDHIDIFCYAGTGCSPWRRNNNKPVPKDVLRLLLTPRDKTERVNHMGLYLRNECPHLDWGRVHKLSSKFSFSQLINKSCEHPMCTSNKVYACLHCFSVFCGASQQGLSHMYEHSQRTGHLLIIAIRRLDIWCYSCDRYIGVGGTREDTMKGDEVRKIFRTDQLVYHRSRPWEMYENSVLEDHNYGDEALAGQ